MSNGLRLHNPIVEDLLNDTTSEYLSVLMFNPKDRDVAEVLFQISVLNGSDAARTTVEQAFLYFFKDFDQVVCDKDCVCLGNTDSNEIVKLDNTLLSEIRETLEQVFRDPDEIPKEKVVFKNERQRKLWERREETRKQLADAKRKHNSDSGFGLGDLIVGISVLGHHTLDEILQMPYAFAQELFKRHQKAESFHIETQTAIFAKKAELKYWLG